MEKLQVLIFKNIHMYDEGPLQIFVSRTSLKSSKENRRIVAALNYQLFLIIGDWYLFSP